MEKGIVIILNGPPSSGKDSIAHAISETKGMFPGHEQPIHLEVKQVLFEQVLAISQISSKEWFDRYNDRTLKEMPWGRLGGLSCREFMIKVSEEYVKPIFGSDFYGKSASLRAFNAIGNSQTAVFSDGGFQSEFNSIRDVVGEDNILLVRLHRLDLSFDSDSRDYLSHPPFEMDLYNNESIGWAVKEIHRFIKDR